MTKQFLAIWFVRLMPIGLCLAAQDERPGHTPGASKTRIRIAVKAEVQVDIDVGGLDAATPPQQTPARPVVTQGASPSPAASGSTGELKKLALLVGINDYKAAKHLSGCVSDVRNMEELLKGSFDFPDGSIATLTDDQATHAAIVTAFKDHLIARAAKDAVVVFHYSGHGSQMKDPADKSSSRLISTIVPHDSRTAGVYDISADELRALFRILSAKTKNITFVFDSCHSGLALRDIASAQARVIDPDTRIPPPPPPGAQVVARAVGEADEGLRGRGYALLSACQADEVAFEYADEKQQPCGTLTHFFVAEARGSGKAGATYRDVMDKVKAKVTGEYRQQHPQLEGAKIDDYLLSDESSLAQPFVVASPEGDGITLEAGQVHGMTEGSVFDVYPPGTKSFADPAKAIARVKLTSVDAYRSTAKLIQGRPIDLSSRAVERQHNFEGRKIRLHLADTGQSAVLGRVRAATVGPGRTDPKNSNSRTFNQTFEIVDKPAVAQLLLMERATRQKARSIVLLGADATELSPPTAVDEPGAVVLLLEQLAGWWGRHGSRDRKVRLHLADTSQSPMLQGVREAVMGGGRIDPNDAKSPTFGQSFEVIDEPAAAQLSIVEQKTGTGARRIALQMNPGGNARELLFQTSIDETGAVELILERLAKWAKWLNLLNLENRRQGLNVDFEIRLAAGSRDPELLQRPDLTLVAGQKVEYTVTNRSGNEVYFAILDLASDGSVGVLYPGEGRTEALGNGESRKGTATASLPEGRKLSRDNLKLFVTQTPVDFRFLRQDQIRELPKNAGDPLADLLGQAALMDRNLDATTETLDGWATKTQILEIVEKRMVTP